MKDSENIGGRKMTTLSDNISNYPIDVLTIPAVNVREFIRQLKMQFVHGTSWESKFVNDTIKKLAGDALVGEGVV